MKLNVLSLNRIDIHHLSDVGGDDPEFPELGLGYSKISDL
jgi:hypothetical protein